MPPPARAPERSPSVTTATIDRVVVSPERLTRLRRFNAIMGLLHLVQGIFMILVSNDTTYPIYTNFLRFDLETFTLSADPQLWFELRFGPAVASFLLISAVAHGYLATIGFARYARDLRRGMNPVRFYEYALSSSVMIVLIGMLVGIWDLGAILLIFTLNATMNLFGIMMEYHNYYTKRVDWTAFVYGSVAGIVPWIVIFLNFYGAVNSGGGEGPPAFVYVVIPTLFVFFNVFAVNMVLQYKKVGAWRDYLYGERAYIILSLAAKSALCWMIWTGTLAPI
jgi:hypothetical protein